MPISKLAPLSSVGWRRRTLLPALLVISSGLMVGCGGGSDDDSGSGGDGLFMRARINGQMVEYRQFPVAALYAYLGKADGLLVAGAVQGSQTYPSMSLQIIDPDGVKLKTYQENELGPSFRYSPQADEHYISGVGGEMDFRLTITNMSGGIMRGTFSGTIRDEASDGRRINWMVTDGAFALEIRRP